MYLIDTNVFIDAKNRYYPFDIVPGFWDWLKSAHLSAKIYTVEAVYDEVVCTADELCDWIKRMPKSFTLPASDIGAASLTRLSEWANSCPQYTRAAVFEFLGAADYFLVAHAHSISATVVTHERAGTGSRNRVKIPDACEAVGVSWMNPFDMLRTEQAAFRL
ncbi:DUF4411 family protein [Micromonospora sp. NPDC049047]|uniref:DUF4411 family protein n=1 Tax=Micromonospora sp. NPDC049047 TaxID=3155645 RepID=UPI0034063AAD